VARAILTAEEEMPMTEVEWLASDEPIQQLEAERGWPSPRKQRL